MGRTALLRTSAVEEVLAFLQDAPEAQVSATIEVAETLIEEIDPSSTYPAEFVVWRLIGERRTSSTEEIPGEELRRELSVLIQRTSSRVPSSITDVPGGAMDLHEAAASIGVSVRTVQRWRDEGLALRHFTFGDGQVRLGVLNRALERFRDRSPGRILKAARFTRLDAVEEQEILARAGSLIDAGSSLNQAAQQIASDSDRSHETIRQLIRRRRGQRGPVTGVGGRISDRDRRLVIKGIDRGVSIPRIAERIGRSTASTRRIAAEVRSQRLAALRPDWIDLPAFDQEDAEKVLLEASEIVARSVQPPPAGAPARVLLEFIREPTASPERLLLPGMHLERRIGARRIDQLPRTPPVSRLDEIETGLRRADMLRRRAGEAVLGAAVARVEQQLGTPLHTIEEGALASWIAFCVRVVDGLLDEFDLRARGEMEPRLDRRVSLETDKQLALMEREGVVAPESVDGDAATADGLLASLETVREALGMQTWQRIRLGSLPDEVQRVVTARFGLGLQRPMTAAGVGTSTGLSTRRVNDLVQEARHLLRQEST